MGTVYTVKAVPFEAANEQLFASNVYEHLTQVDGLFSTYKPNSEISIINRAAVGDCTLISGETQMLLEKSFELGEITNGRFDISVGPLVDLWGFGPKGTINQPPTNADIKDALNRIGFEAIKINQTNVSSVCVEKLKPREIDLSAIAKGYGVDVVANSLLELGYSSFLIELGGEIWAQGRKGDGSPWKVAIEVPDRQSPEKRIARVIEINRPTAMATSGDYRNFFQYQGKTYSHTLNTQTGFPVDHQLASVTVLTEETALADAWATALLAMPIEKSKQLADEHQLAVLFIERNEVLDGDKKHFDKRSIRLSASSVFCARYGCDDF